MRNVGFLTTFSVGIVAGAMLSIAIVMGWDWLGSNCSVNDAQSTNWCLVKRFRDWRAPLAGAFAIGVLLAGGVYLLRQILLLQSFEGEAENLRQARVRKAGVFGTAAQWTSAICAAIAAAFAIIISSQVEIAERGTVAQAWQLVTRTQVDIGRILVDRPDLWPYFHEGEPPPKSGTELRQTLALADLYLDWFDHFDDEFMQRLPLMGPGEKERLQWESYFAGMFRSSPVLCMRFQATRELYGSTVNKLGGRECDRRQ